MRRPGPGPCLRQQSGTDRRLLIQDPLLASLWMIHLHFVTLDQMSLLEGSSNKIADSVVLDNHLRLSFPNLEEGIYLKKFKIV